MQDEGENAGSRMLIQMEDVAPGYSGGCGTQDTGCRCS